jgi:putative Mg2+ transporter-C (MgtC) family protein
MDLMDTNWSQQLQAVVSVVIAAVLGGIIGAERELADRPAGLRTHAILAAAACLLVSLADVLIGHFVLESAPSVLRADPVRIVEAIVTGTAFLGAGTIFRHHDKGAIEGLTTAASLLLVAAIGISVALQQLLIAGLVTLLTLLVLRSARLFSAGRHSAS